MLHPRELQAATNAVNGVMSTPFTPSNSAYFILTSSSSRVASIMLLFITILHTELRLSAQLESSHPLCFASDEFFLTMPQSWSFPALLGSPGPNFWYANPDPSVHSLSFSRPIRTSCVPLGIMVSKIKLCSATECLEVKCPPRDWQ